MTSDAPCLYEADGRWDLMALRRELSDLAQKYDLDSRTWLERVERLERDLLTLKRQQNTDRGRLNSIHEMASA